MRIIAGKWKSRRIAAPRAAGVRPTTDRTRETIFDVLENVLDFSGCAVYDLFAGSGAMGIEALSRGARHATFVERARGSVFVLERNLAAFGCAAAATLVRGDALRFVRDPAVQPAEVVFADPPYRYEQRAELAAAVLRRGLFTRAFVLECSAERTFALPNHPPWRVKTIGTTIVQFYRRDA